MIVCSKIQETLGIMALDTNIFSPDYFYSDIETINHNVSSNVAVFIGPVTNQIYMCYATYDKKLMLTIIKDASTLSPFNAIYYSIDPQLINPVLYNGIFIDEY